MVNKTISLPEDVLPVIDALEVPFSTWVADQLRRYAASKSTLSFERQLLADAELADAGRPDDDARRAIAARMQASAPW